MDEKDKVQFAIEAWKTTIDVQKHFNELQLDVRKSTITIASALLGAAAFIWKEDPLSYLGSGLVVLAIFAVVLYRIFDRHNYYRFLLASVKHGQAIEDYLASSMGHDVFGLSRAIGEGSAIGPNELRWLRPFTRFLKGGKIHSRHRLEAVYAGFIALLVVLALGLAWFTHEKRVVRAEAERRAEVVRPATIGPRSSDRP